MHHTLWQRLQALRQAAHMGSLPHVWLGGVLGRLGGEESSLRARTRTPGQGAGGGSQRKPHSCCRIIRHLCIPAPLHGSLADQQHSDQCCVAAAMGCHSSKQQSLHNSWLPLCRVLELQRQQCVWLRRFWLGTWWAAVVPHFTRLQDFSWNGCRWAMGLLLQGDGPTSSSCLGGGQLSVHGDAEKWAKQKPRPLAEGLATR